MASFTIPMYFFTALILFHLKFVAAEQSSSFSFKTFGEDPNFESKIALYGDAHVADHGSVIQLTNSVKWSAGRVMYKKPIKLVEEFDTSKDGKYGGLNENHVGIDVGSLVSVKVRNLSSVNLVLNNGEKLHSWIDYEATSKRLEIRLSESSSTRPNEPWLSHSIDLATLWKDEEVFVGLSSSNGNSSQTCFIHLWSFKLRQVPNWMHSQPLDPEAISKNPEPSTTAHKSSNCLWKVLAMFIFGCACGVLTASCLLHLWTTLGARRPVAPEECSVHPVEFEYKKVKIVVDEVVKDDTK
ncbi:hypothetical protein V6Z11_A09G188700 [Gossypium hirsutum]